MESSKTFTVYPSFGPLQCSQVFHLKWIDAYVLLVAVNSCGSSNGPKIFIMHYMSMSDNSSHLYLLCSTSSIVILRFIQEVGHSGRGAKA